MENKPSYKVVLWDFNRKKAEFYDVMPYFMDECEKQPKAIRPKTREEWFKWVTSTGMYQFWSRCQYEILVDGFPPSTYRLDDVDYKEFEEDYKGDRKYLQEFVFDCIDSKPCTKIDVWDQIEANLPIVVELLMNYYGK